jgi:RimJ/RimL family protein N-acetyltransferase/acyl carrier protein
MADARATAVAGVRAFPDFVEVLSARLDLEPDGWAPDDGLDRLGWDSLRVAEVLTWLDDLGIRLPDDLVPELRTLADLHHYVVTIGTRPAEAAPHRRRPLVGRRVRLVALAPEHHGAALDLYTRGDHLTRYRLRGATPSPDGFHRALWDRALAQFVVVHDGRVVGVVSAYEPDLRNRHVHVAVVAAEDAPAGVGVEGLALLVDHLFREFDLRKVYAEVLAPNLAAFGSGVGRLFVVEGRLTEHEYLDGRYHDMVVLALGRSRWEATVDRILGPGR